MSDNPKIIHLPDGTTRMQFVLTQKPWTEESDLYKLKVVYEMSNEESETMRVLFRRGWTVAAQDISGIELEPPEESDEDYQHTSH